MNDLIETGVGEKRSVLMTQADLLYSNYLSEIASWDERADRMHDYWEALHAAWEIQADGTLPDNTPLRLLSLESAKFGDVYKEMHARYKEQMRGIFVGRQLRVSIDPMLHEDPGSVLWKRSGGSTLDNIENEVIDVVDFWLAKRVDGGEDHRGLIFRRADGEDYLASWDSFQSIEFEKDQEVAVFPVTIP